MLIPPQSPLPLSRLGRNNNQVVVKEKERPRMSIMVGKEAPDFTADAFDQGQVNKVRLADYRGRWVMLFFYPADFSMV
jgi:hypothetical protein